MICQKDVETMSTSLQCQFQHHYCVYFEKNCGSEIVILETLTSLRHLSVRQQIRSDWMGLVEEERGHAGQPLRVRLALEEN